jgi:hypothetical protein
VDSAEANRQKQRRYHAAHREQVNERKRQRYAANREQEHERARRYRKAANREKRNERERRYRAANRDAVSERDRRRKAANRERDNERDRRRRATVQAETTDAARRHGYVWTGPELEIVARDDLTVKQIALMLGRTYTAVEKARERIRRDPRADFLAGLARQPARTRDGPRGIPGAAAESPKPFAEVNASAATILRRDGGRAPEAR